MNNEWRTMTLQSWLFLRRIFRCLFLPRTAEYKDASIFGLHPVLYMLPHPFRISSLQAFIFRYSISCHSQSRWISRRFLMLRSTYRVCFSYSESFVFVYGPCEKPFQGVSTKLFTSSACPNFLLRRVSSFQASFSAPHSMYIYEVTGTFFQINRD